MVTVDTPLTPLVCPGSRGRRGVGQGYYKNVPGIVCRYHSWQNTPTIPTSRTTHRPLTVKHADDALI